MAPPCAHELAPVPQRTHHRDEPGSSAIPILAPAAVGNKDHAGTLVESNRRKQRMSKYLIVIAVVGTFAVPAVAQTTTTTTEYFVVQDTTTKKCTIVENKPTTTTVVQVGPVAFKSRTEAEAGMKTIKVCETTN